MSNSHSLWVKLDRFPPAVVRLLAVRGRILLTDAQIVKASGLSMADVRHLSHLTSWDEVPVVKMKQFVRACGVDFADVPTMRRLNRLFKRGFKFTAARKSPKWPEYFETLKTLV